MTFKDLKKRVSLQVSQEETRLFERLKGKPFWIWDKQQHKQEDIRTNGDCCFNHIIGLPQKDGVDKPFYDYEQLIFDSLATHNSNKHLWIKKATGLGVSEFLLRFMAWLCLKDNALLGSQMCIVTGPRIDLAITFIDRMEKMFANRMGIPAAFDNKETVIELNSVKIEAFPSHHLDAMRGLPNVSFILLDEADFFPPGQQADARDVSERYIAKSNPYIVMVSTPNAPEGLFERIEKESEDTCLYKRIFLDYTYGIGKIYTAEEIEKAKQSPSFEREYNLKYLGRRGNVFHTKDIEAAIEKGRKYNPDIIVPFTSTSMGIDPA
ncbi:MAG: DEAD/DEAH box helicase family protein [Nitrososphaeraceae archaeon]